MGIFTMISDSYANFMAEATTERRRECLKLFDIFERNCGSVSFSGTLVFPWYYAVVLKDSDNITFEVGRSENEVNSRLLQWKLESGFKAAVGPYKVGVHLAEPDAMEVIKKMLQHAILKSHKLS